MRTDFHRGRRATGLCVIAAGAVCALALCAPLALAQTTAAPAGAPPTAAHSGAKAALAGPATPPVAPPTAASTAAQPASPSPPPKPKSEADVCLNEAAPGAPPNSPAVAPQVAPPISVLADLQKRAAATSNDPALAALGVQAAAIEAEAQTRLAACRGQVSSATMEMRRLSGRMRGGGTLVERHARAQLQGRRERFLGAQSQAQALVTAAGQTFSLVAERRRNEFGARVLQRSPSPLSPDFWSDLQRSGNSDLIRLRNATDNAAAIALEAREPRGALAFAGGLLLLLVLLIPGRRLLEAWARRGAIEPTAPTTFTRSSRALWIAAVNTALPALAGFGLHLATRWGGLLSEKADALAGAAVIALVWGAAILALGRSLVTAKRPDQRLLDLPHPTAARLKRCLWAVALVTGSGFLLTRLNYVVGASVAATIASNAAMSIAYAAVASLILLSLRGEEPADDTAPSARSIVWTLISLALTAAIMAIIGAVVLGYSTLAALISGQVFWLSVLAASTFLLLRFVDELCTALFIGKGWAGRSLTRLFGLRRTTAEQIGVLTSAALQLLIMTSAVTLALTPFGASGDIFLADLGKLGDPIRLGTATISPIAIASGLISLAIGLATVQLIRGWFVKRFLPVTDWDVGLRTSVSTGVTYLGVGLTILCAFGAMGLGFQQIALVASALSVGIGFGLQNVVQNFVSGLILLIERPVKVGDWVHVADVEGDIRRIRVRATEIQLFDRSTVIVPNSDLITKSVQNKSLGDPRGRIQLQISIANPADALKARDLIASLAKENGNVLSDPAPAIFIDSLAAGGAVNFNCYLYVSNPRNTYKVRSELYFAVLDLFEKSGIGFVGAAAPQTMVIEPGPTLERLLQTKTA